MTMHRNAGAAGGGVYGKSGREGFAVCLKLAAVILLILSLSACGSGRAQSKGYNTGWPDGGGTYSVKGNSYQVMNTGQGYYQEGQASWYGRELHGRKTASGERFNMHQMTAAHRNLPFDTWAVVKNMDNGHEVVVRINDRGPFHKSRIIDLSRAAARRIGLDGVGRVSVRAVTEAEAHQIMRGRRSK